MEVEPQGGGGNHIQPVTDWETEPGARVRERVEGAEEIKRLCRWKWREPVAVWGCQCRLRTASQI